ncbi:type II toxin-antitoxin system VapC family toxin [Caenispirillum bisanense]|uniref:type II toxin-antitoxin system VapC family toxin n=1 Tax=Caenispirillum bisanense TaxID=414052 RepID=UPI0031D1E427
MRLLLDTHALLWWLEGSDRLPARVQETVSTHRRTAYVSAISALELTIKFRLGKLPTIKPWVHDLRRTLWLQGFLTLDVTLDHAQAAGLLPGDHRDPFDRMLAAQALSEDMALVSCDSALDDFGVRRIW